MILLQGCVFVLYLCTSGNFSCVFVTFDPALLFPALCARPDRAYPASSNWLMGFDIQFSDDEHDRKSNGEKYIQSAKTNTVEHIWEILHVGSGLGRIKQLINGFWNWHSTMMVIMRKVINRVYQTPASPKLSCLILFVVVILAFFYFEISLDICKNPRFLTQSIARGRNLVSKVFMIIVMWIPVLQ